MQRIVQYQSGQSTVEFAIVSAAIVPFILVLGLMAKFSDIQHAASQASQYAVWEKALNPAKAGPQISNEVRARFFTRMDRAFGNREIVGDTEDAHRPYWSDPRNRRLIQHFSDVHTIETQYGLQPAKQAFDLAANIFVSAMNLNEDGMWKAHVLVPLQKQTGEILSPFDRLNIQPEATAALLTDNWAAANKATVNQTISDWKVTTTDPIVTLAVQTLAHVFSYLGLEADPSSFKNKNIDQDVIPCEVHIVRGTTSC